jgi:ABC-type uncharacterized transport system substrate-binding protein
MTDRRHLSIGLIAAMAAASLPSAVAAHPHVLVDAKSEVVFDAEGRMKSVRQVWQFDPAFSAYAAQGLDADGDGTYSDAELQPLAKVNVESLKEFDFFTFLTVGDNELDFVEPQEYWLEVHGDRLTLFYDLPLKEPIAVGPNTTLEVFDPDYFVAFNFVQKDPVILDGAPEGCTAVYHPPKEIDDQTMAILNARPQDQRELPPELADAAAGLANLAEIKCP